MLLCTWTTEKGEENCLPPFIKANISIMIEINLIKETEEPSLGHCKAYFAESSCKLVRSYATIVVPVYRCEEEA